MTNRASDDDAAARKARADAIRRARDLRNAGQTPPADDVPDSEAMDEPGTGPNYVDLIDRKMKEMEED